MKPKQTTSRSSRNKKHRRKSIQPERQDIEDLKKDPDNIYLPNNKKKTRREKGYKKESELTARLRA